VRLCHKIPLNERGDTVESLEREGDRDKARAAVLAWLKKTVRAPQKRSHCRHCGPDGVEVEGLEICAGDGARGHRRRVDVWHPGSLS
jgi:hypothetical protein